MCIRDSSEPNGLILCDNLSDQFYTFDLEAGVKYEFEVTRDTTQCALGSYAAQLYKGDCVNDDCTYVAGTIDGARSECGQVFDPFFEFTAPTTGKYTLKVAHIDYHSLPCPTGGYKYSAKATVVSVPCSFIGQSDVVVTIDADFCHYETSWDIVIAGTSKVVVAVGQELTYIGVHTWTVCMPNGCLLYTSPSPRDRQKSRMPSSA